MWFAGSGGVDHRILGRYEPEIAVLHPSKRHEASLGREPEAPIPACSQKVETVVEPVAGTRERRAAELQQQTRSEALESAIRAAQQLQLPTLDISLDEIQAIEAQPFHDAVDCRQRPRSPASLPASARMAFPDGQGRTRSCPGASAE